MSMRVASFVAVSVLILLAACASPRAAPNAPLTADLAHYPEFFDAGNGTFDARIVVDSEAPVEDRASAEALASSLEERFPGSAVSVVEYPAFSDILGEDSILVGSCSPRPQNRFVNIYVDCLSMREDQAIVRIVDKDGVWIFAIVGRTPGDTRVAIDALIRGDERIRGQDVEVRDLNGTIVIGEPT